MGLGKKQPRVPPGTKVERLHLSRYIWWCMTHFENMRPYKLYAKFLHQPEDGPPQVIDAGAISRQSFSTKGPLTAIMCFHP